MQNPFNQPGEWLRGNLHCHSNQSDGEPSPQGIVDVYSGAGYDFLTIADHNKLTDVTVLDHRGMTLIPGCELNGGRAEFGQHYHVVLIGQREPAAASPDMAIQDLINAALQVGELCWIAHPSWSSITSAEILNLEGPIGIEVFNTTCQRGIGRGESVVQWDELLARGKQVLGLAVDDAHWHYPDALGGWINVRSQSREMKDIITAIRDGMFYASTGPEIRSVHFEGRHLTVECSPAREVRLVCPAPGRGWTSFRSGCEGPYEFAECTIPEAWDMVRVEIVDECGQRAWTNPFALA